MVQHHGMMKHIFAAILVLAPLVSPAHADSDDDRLKQLHERYQCPIFSYLSAIHRTPQARPNRYIIVSIKKRAAPIYFVQCAFENKDRRLYCEASSPYFNDELWAYFTPERLQVLKALGYTTKPTVHNYHQKPRISDDKSLFDIAGLFVESLGRLYDMQPDEGLDYDAPEIKGQPSLGTEGVKYCAPLISSR
jgi:hypothetical protein